MAAVALCAALVASEPAAAYHHGWHRAHWRHGWHGATGGMGGTGLTGATDGGDAYWRSRWAWNLGWAGMAGAGPAGGQHTPGGGDIPITAMVMATPTATD
jgi:hypothetical protein